MYWTDFYADYSAEMASKEVVSPAEAHEQAMLETSAAVDSALERALERSGSTDTVNFLTPRADSQQLSLQTSPQ